MGNTSSRGPRKFLDDSVNWQEYYAADWRSERARELDRHGGPGRPPVARGDSVTAKLVFLEGALKHEQRRMKQVLQVLDDEQQRREQQAQAHKAPPERLPDYILNTDFRAYERTHTAEDPKEAEGAAAAAQQQQKDFSLLAKDPDLRRKMMEQRKKMMEYAKRVNVVKGAPGISKPLNLPAIKSKVASSWKPEEQHCDEEEAGGEGTEGGAWASTQPAEWRVRMHAARRRLILLVGAVARWQIALSRRPGPKRLPRVNSFSYFIPQVLGVEAKRFIEEANTIAKIKADAEKTEEPIAEAALERIPPADLSPPPNSYPRNRQQLEPMEAPESLRSRRGPPRRGVSDSGCPGAAAAAAAAVAAVDADAAAGGVGAAGSDGAGGGGALGGAAARPKRRPELRKSSSGKCSSSSLPDSLMPGHTSDVEAYAPPRRLYSSRVASTRLPAIGSGRVSASGILAALVPHHGAGAGAGAGAGGEVPSPPMVARQPRAKLSRISSSSGQQQNARASRRQSDTSLAMAVAVAAAAATSATSPAAAGGGGGSAAERRAAAAQQAAGGSARTSGWRSRGSDSGSMRRQRDGSDAGGGGGGGHLLNGHRQSTSGTGSLASPRRSETGQQMTLASAGSAPPDSPSAAAAAAAAAGGGAVGGFLPRISSSSGVGTAVSSPPSTSKPMTLAQARRLALLAEAGTLTGNTPAAAGEDGSTSRSSNATSSPSRLGPLKLGNGTVTPLGSASSRSPDQAGGGSGGGGVGGGSILDALRQSRDGSAPASSLGALPLAAGGMRELREALALAGGGVGTGPSAGGGPLSPLGSPAPPGGPRVTAGMRARAISMDAALTSPLPTGLTSSTSSPARHSATSLGPPPPSGAASPGLPAPLPHPNPHPAPAAAGPDDDEAAAPLVSPTAAPLPLAPPPASLRPSASAPSAASAPPPAVSAPSSAAATTSSTTSTLSSTISSMTSSSSAPASSIGSSAGPGPGSAAGLPPLGPHSKPPLGPAGTGERVRSGRSANSYSAPTSASANPLPPPPAPSQPPSSPPPPAATAGSSAGGVQPPSAAAAEPPPLDPEAAARLAKAQQLMGMYANRVNATWAESQQWGPPSVLSVPEQEAFCASDAWVPYKVTVMRMLKSGSLGVHIDACADAVQLPDGTIMDIWTSDPWVLAQKLRPGSLPLSDRIEGVSLGARALQQLVLAVEALAGREAVPRLTVVLAINDDQRNAVVADIIRTRAYGLKPENLILTAQRKRCGYRYDRDAQAFLEDPSTPAQVLGSGFSLCQLAWLGDAFSVTREGELSMLMGRTLLERFTEARVEWLVARRARDLALLTAEGVLDLPHLAFALYAADRHSGNMVVQAAPATSLTIPRAYDSTLLCLRNPPGSAGRGTSAGAGPASTRVASVAASAAGVEGGGAAAGVVDLRAAELSSPVMVEALAAVRKQAGHEGWVGLQRCLLHVPTLHAMLNTLGIFRPKLTMSGDVARLSLDAADITADRRVACVAVHTRTSPAILTSPNEVDDLIPLLLAQDHSAAFRDIIAASNDAARDATFSMGGAGGEASSGGAAAAAISVGGASAVSSGGAPGVVALLASKPGIRILLFIAANEVTQLAVNLVLLMARPGRDVVQLVTVVHNSLQMPTGQALLLKYLKQISNSMIEAHSEVLVKGGCGGLLEVMEGAAARLAPQLVVMASAALTMTHLNTASVMGSVTLSVLKRLAHLPVAVATSNSKNLVLTQRRTALRCMVLVEPTSRPALSFCCSSCMEPMRGDKLVLAGHHPTRQMTTQQQQAQRRLTDNFGDIASSHRFHTPTKLQLDGPVDKALSTAAEEESVHLVGLQVPLGTRGLPGHVLGLIRSCRGGVLVFRDAAAPPPGEGGLRQ